MYLFKLDLLLFYSLILEDVGQEKWDEDLHSRLYEDNLIEVSLADVRLAHEQLLDANNVNFDFYLSY